MDRLKAIKDYIGVLKPRETGLLIAIGLSAAISAGGGHPSWRLLLLVLTAVALGSAGCNGLTNYLDRGVDARMQRTRHRSLPSKRIYPPQKVLPLLVGLVVLALGLAWYLSPLCFIAGLAGTVASVVGRKTILCTPLGVISGCSPVLIGWLAVDPHFRLTLLLLCILIAIWIPLHVWSVMIANRDDYLQAGVRYFPVSRKLKDAIKVLLVLSLIIYPVSIILGFIAQFGMIYLAITNLLGILMVYASSRLLASGASRDAWRLYKLSAFPYLGLVFLAMCVDLWFPVVW